MYITGSDKNHHVKLVTTQTRVVTTKNLGLENGVEGQYAKAKTLTLILKDVDETQVKRTRVDFNMFTKDHFYHLGGSKNNRNSMIEAIITNYDTNIQEVKEVRQYSLFDLAYSNIPSNKSEKLINYPAANL
jgi:hypothetical protein